uniref:DNA-directed RNA polymerase subunit beta n=1 Tax=Lygus hesperus TaxID=30085 RepID=A0A0A9VUF3_LYGHE
MSRTVLKVTLCATEDKYRNIPSSHPFPIHKLARKSSSDSIIDSQTRFLPILVCDCPLTAQALPDPQRLPRVIVKDSANFAKFRRDVEDFKSPLVNNGSFSTSSTTKARHGTGSLRPPIKDASRERPSQFSGSSRVVLTRKINKQLKSNRSLLSVAIPEDAEGHINILEPPKCSLNDHYIVKRIIYTLEDNLENNSLSRNRPPSPE